MSISQATFSANGRNYSPAGRPIVVICLDGSSDEYLDAAITRGQMPNLLEMCLGGYRGLARGQMPSFTNVNNSSIITGVPPSVHGISGNFFLDPQTGQEVMMNSSRYLRTGTIPAAAQKAGRKVGIVTAKDKLREILGAGLFGSGGVPAIAFSSEKVDQAVEATHGIGNAEEFLGLTKPHIYSGEASLFVFDAGAILIQRGLADFLYLSTTDFIQHKYAPEEQGALSFYKGVDRGLGKLLRLGAIVALTADHGMNAKQKEDGSPNVIYLETILAEKFKGALKVILPITDPYVVHHGALGAYALIHGPADAPFAEIQRWLMTLPWITEVLDRTTAAAQLQLPPDRLGDLVVMSGRDVVLGLCPEKHDLKEVATGLRSHGGRYEEMVPFIFSEPLNAAYLRKAAGDPRNFDVFDFVCNGVVSKSAS